MFVRCVILDWLWCCYCYCVSNCL